MTRVHQLDAESNGVHVQMTPKDKNGKLDEHHKWPFDSDGVRRVAKEGDDEEEEEKKEEEDDDPGTFKEAFLDICENTSFQGVPYVVADTPFTIRR